MKLFTSKLSIGLIMNESPSSSILNGLARALESKGAFGNGRRSTSGIRPGLIPGSSPPRVQEDAIFSGATTLRGKKKIVQSLRKAKGSRGGGRRRYADGRGKARLAFCCGDALGFFLLATHPDVGHGRPEVVARTTPWPRDCQCHLTEKIPQTLPCLIPTLA